MNNLDLLHYISTSLRSGKGCQGRGTVNPAWHVLMTIAMISIPILSISQVYTCVEEDQIYVYGPGFDVDPFGSPCSTYSMDTTSGWRVWGETDDMNAMCANLDQWIPMISTSVPYPASVNDTIEMAFSCSIFYLEDLAEILAQANLDELNGISNDHINGEKRVLIAAGYIRTCFELEEGVDHVKTRYSVDNGSTWMEPYTSNDPFVVPIFDIPCAEFAFANPGLIHPAPDRWTGTDIMERSWHLFDVFQGFRATMPTYYSAQEFLDHWGYPFTGFFPPYDGPMVRQQLILDSDENMDGSAGWSMYGSYLLWFKLQTSGLEVAHNNSENNHPRIDHSPEPILHCSHLLLGATLKILDSSGRLVRVAKLNNITTLIGEEIDPGLYVIQIQKENDVFSQPFIKP